MWLQIALLVASFIISYAVRRKAQVPKPPSFEDLNLPQSAEGTEQAIDFGTVWTKEWMVLGAANYRTESIKRKVSKK